MYLTAEMAHRAIHNMAQFYSTLQDIYAKHDMDIQEDLGRRNILMSKPQEKYFAGELKRLYPTTKSDGKTGQPDITVPEIGREIECKLTSAHKSGAWRLQTDYETLKKKEKLDYLYVLCDEDFKNFCVLHFEGLTIDDFNLPGKGSRNKANLNLDRAMCKCHVLVGDYELAAQSKIRDIEQKLLAVRTSQVSRRKQLEKSLELWRLRKSITFKLEAIA
jgi:hypothetical protein